MGFFDSLKTIFQNGNNQADETTHCEELIRLITFAQKTKHLSGGNYGIYVSYSRPDHNKSEYTSKINAEYGFYDFDCITHAREFALEANASSLAANMVQLYYNKINTDANMTESDWPYGMDVYDFARMLTNRDEFGFYGLIPDQNNEDIFTMKVKVGFASQNGILACKLVKQECLKNFPSLVITDTYSNTDFFHFKINI